jgi:acetolactate synthase I/II/III large subunit
MPRISGNQFFARVLAEYGVTSVFYVPVIVPQALLEMKKLNIRPVLAHSEKAAAYMADGYARASHKPGVCMAQSVGAANLAAGLQDAYLGLSPVIAITGCQPHSNKYRNSYQEIDHHPLFEPVTKFQASANDIEHLSRLLKQAFRESTSGGPGPAYLELQGIDGSSLLKAETDLEPEAEARFGSYPAFRPEPNPDDLRQAVNLIAQSRKPVIVAGGGVTASQAGPMLVKLAEKLLIPVATSLNAKDSMPENHPLAIGVVGSYSGWCANQLITESDLVIYIGSHAGSQVTHDWRIPGPDTSIIQIDIDPRELGRNYPVKVAVLGDATVTLKRLLKLVETVSERKDWMQTVRQKVTDWHLEIDQNRHSAAIPIRPERLCHEITEMMPSDAILVSDTGHSAMWAGTMVYLRSGQRFIRCAGSLGWALPASMGVKCARPQNPVICFTGDGGFWYHIAELETAARCGINTIIVVNNNNSLNQVSQAYTGKLDGDDLWKFSEIDFSSIARSMGCFGKRVTQPDKLKNALEEALESGKPAVIDVVSDQKAMGPVGWKPT